MNEKPESPGADWLLKNFDVCDDGVLTPKNDAGGSFAYNDGDQTEERILGIIAGTHDRAIGSMELEAAIHDFPSRYHLSNRRVNLLRPLRELLRGSILEVGAGFGAITRFLGENGASVWALEGSPRRARAARERCRGLDNVQVIRADFADFSPPHHFDAVLLIGVLEYASLLFRKGGGFAGMLERCASLLEESGILVVAIENQLGLKYLAGAPEDHAGIPFYGVEGLYRPNEEAATFGRLHLQRLIEGSGLRHATMYYPFPDYKFPRVVVGEGAAAGGFDIAPLIRSCASEVYGIPWQPHFSEEMAWPVAVCNGLIPELANSFLVVASRNDLEPPHSKGVAVYSETRRRCYAKETIIEVAGGTVSVTRERLFDDPPPDKGRYRQVIEPETWITGRLLRDSMYEIVNRPGWSVVDVANWAKPWLAFLENHALASTDGGDVLLPPEFVDCTPANCMDTADGIHAFDLEWVDSSPVPLKYVAFRGVLFMLAGARSVAPPDPGTPRRLSELIPGILRQAGLCLDESELAELFERERTFQDAVTGEIAPSAEQLADLELPCFRQVPETLITEAHRAITARDAAIAELNVLLDAANMRAAEASRRAGEVFAIGEREVRARGEVIEELTRETERRGEAIAELTRETERRGEAVTEWKQRYDRLLRKWEAAEFVRRTAASAVSSYRTALEETLNSYRAHPAWKIMLTLRRMCARSGIAARLAGVAASFSDRRSAAENEIALPDLPLPRELFSPGFGLADEAGSTVEDTVR